MCIKKIADSLMLPSSEARAGGPLPRAGGGGQSIMVDSWFQLVCGNTIPVRSKRSIHCDRVRHATLEWHEGGSWGCQGHRFILDI